MRQLLLVVACLFLMALVVGCEDRPASAPGKKAGTSGPVAPQSAPVAQTPIRLATGVALPQTGPEGTLMSFSVDYQFTAGEPSPAGYAWVIERAQGAPARQPVRLERQGTLTALLPGWRPEEGPFRSHLEDAGGNRLSASIEMR